MGRWNSIPRTGMYEKAFEFAKSCGIYFEQKTEEEKRKALDKWLDKNFLLYWVDMTHPKDDGSREECLLVVKKPLDYKYDNDYMFYNPDLTTELVACFWR